MYNLATGVNPLAPILLRVLNLEAHKVPRWRDTYLDPKGPYIVVYTRTGGGNRETYQEQNAALRAAEGFVDDWDDSLDSTYAHWAYHVPSSFQALIDEMIEIHPGITETPRQKMERTLRDLEAGKQTTDTERLEKGLRPVIEQLIGTLGADDDTASEKS